MVCSGMRVDEFQKLDLLVCFGEEEKYKEKSKVKIGRSKEYVCRCVEEKKKMKKNINKCVDERKRDKEKNKIENKKLKLRNVTIIFSQ